MKGLLPLKIKEGFILRQVGDQAVVVAVGAASRNFNGIIKLNPTGKFLWEKLENDTTSEQLLAEMLDAYDIDEDTAKSDISQFIAKLKGADLLV